MGDATVNQVTFSVTAPKLPSMPKAPNVNELGQKVPKGNWAKFYAKKEKFFSTKGWSIVFFLWGWAQLVFSAITIYYVTAIDAYYPGSLNAPRFRHGTVQTQQAQMQYIADSEKHDLQVYLILTVALAAPLSIFSIGYFHKIIFNSEDNAVASDAAKQTSSAICSTLHFASFVNWIAGQVFYFRCLPSGFNSCFDAPYKTVAGIWIFYSYFYIVFEFLQVLIVAFCVSDEEGVVDGEEKDE